MIRFKLLKEENMKFQFFSNGGNKKLDKKTMHMLFIVFVVGVILLILSQLFNNKSPEQPAHTVLPSVSAKRNDSLTYEEKLERKLEDELSKIQNVGNVEVILTLKAGKEMVLDKDMPMTQSKINEQDSEGGSRISEDQDVKETTVIVNNPDGSTNPIILKELEPEVNGIVIIAQGGDDLIVKNNLINAAKVLLDIPAHKIEVMKMED